MIPANIPELFNKQVSCNRSRIAFEYRLRRNEPYRSISWQYLNTLVRETSYGLVELGLQKGNTVAIISNTRYEWAICDLSILSCGGIVIPVYPTLNEHAVNYILNDSDCSIVIVEDKGQLQKIRSQWDKLPKIKYAIVIEDLGDIPTNDPRILNLHKLRDRGRLNFSHDPYLIERYTNSLSIDDIATIIYTSGTTGHPKGVMLSHKNILSVLSVLPKLLPAGKNDKFLSFLPLSHVLERVGGLYYAIYTGATVCYCSSIDQIGAALQDSEATIMLVVPRILEKIYSKLQVQLQMLSGDKKKLFDWALDLSKKYIKLKSEKNPKYLLYFVQKKIAAEVVFAKIRKKLAPTLKCFVSGGAPLSPEIAEFFNIIGIPVLEGYGLTETSAPVTVNTLVDIKPGTVGRPLPNVQIKIADDGEILIKGPTVFCGYYKNPEATNDSFRDGWFYSGDIGFFDKAGFLKITDRKKDIIVNSAGKNIAPQNIENAAKTSPYISNIVVIGDKRKYLSALITLDTQMVDSFAKEHNISYSNGVSGLSRNQAIIKLIDEQIKLKTVEFSDYEQIRRFTILPSDFTIESGEITPTLKVKRKFIEQKYKELINSMYPVD